MDHASDYAVNFGSELVAKISRALLTELQRCIDFCLDKLVDHV